MLETGILCVGVWTHNHNLDIFNYNAFEQAYTRSERGGGLCLSIHEEIQLTLL